MVDKVRRLTPLESFRLMNLLVAEYTSSGKNDNEFADYAAEQCNIPGLNKDHIKGRRNELGIDSHREVMRKPESVLERIRQLEEVVLAQTVRIQKLESFFVDGKRHFE